MKKLLILLTPFVLTGCLSGFTHQAEVNEFVGWQKDDLLADHSWGEPDEKSSGTKDGKSVEIWHYNDGTYVPNNGISSFFPYRYADTCRHSFSLDGDKIIGATTTCDD
jgi:hypothetical protein